jgi:hypothetical protein
MSGSLTSGGLNTSQPTKEYRAMKSNERRSESSKRKKVDFNQALSFGVDNKSKKPDKVVEK